MKLEERLKLKLESKLNLIDTIHKKSNISYKIIMFIFIIFSSGNGRVTGYDNSHNFHYKHYFGEITELDDLLNYQELVKRFRSDLKEFIK